MKNYFIGVDIGGTYIRVLVFRENDKRIIYNKKSKIIFNPLVEEEINTNLIPIINECCNAASIELQYIGGIGLSLAANFDRISGKITRWSNNKKWEGFPLKKYLNTVFQTTILMEDDANCAGFGEYNFGVVPKGKNGIYITISTGIGAALIMNEQLLTGDTGVAGELGHIKIQNSTEQCSCGAYGCLQAIASGTALRNKLVELLNINHSDKRYELSLEEIVKHPDLDKSEAQRIIKSASMELGRVIHGLSTFLDIKHIILGGSVTHNVDGFLETLTKYLYQINPHIILKEARFRNYNGALGALALVYQRVNNKVVTIRNLEEIT